MFLQTTDIIAIAKRKGFKLHEVKREDDNSYEVFHRYYVDASTTTSSTPQTPTAKGYLRPCPKGAINAMDTMELIMNYVVDRTTAFTTADILSPELPQLDVTPIVDQFKSNNSKLCNAIYIKAGHGLVSIIMNLTNTCAINYFTLLRELLVKEVAHFH